MAAHDAVVVGSGPNGLAAAVVLAEREHRVLVLEAAGTIGGGTRTAELTLPGFRHDVCSGFHPLGAASPLFDRLPLERLGLRWIVPEVQLAHPFDDGGAAALWRSLDRTCEGLGDDSDVWRRAVSRIATGWDDFAARTLKPLARRPWPAPGSLRAALPAAVFARRFRTPAGRALFAGLAAHAMVPLDTPGTAGIGLVLGALAHVGGWPIAEGGSDAVGRALAGHLEALGGSIQTGHPVRTPADIPGAKAVLFDTHPRTLVAVYGRKALGRTAHRRIRHYRGGAASYKIDYALDGPIPWTAPECRRAGTVHVGGTYGEIAAAERSVAEGTVPDRPFVLVGQQSLFDRARAPDGKHTAWVYTHVPSGSTEPVRERVERRIERFAPGFCDLVLAARVTTPLDFESYNPNYPAGDTATGTHSLRRMLGRPGPFRNPYRTGIPGVFLCSAATPPGPGVHGMCGANAALAAIRDRLEGGRRP